MEELNKTYVVTIGQDASILEPTSEGFSRAVSYSKEVHHLHVLVVARKIKNKTIEDGNFSAQAIQSIFSIPRAFFDVYTKIKKAKMSGHNIIVTSQDPFEVGLLSFLLAKVTHSKLHVQVHTDISSPYMRTENIRSRIQVRIADFILPRVNRLRVVSKRIQDFCIKKYRIPQENIDYIPMLYSQGLENQPPNSSAKERYIVMPARFVYFKRIPLALDAFACALSQGSRLRLKIIGRGPEVKKINDKIQKLQIADKVEILPWVDGPQHIYKNAYVTLITSCYEGWCRVANESVEAGVPVIMTDVGCAGGWLEDGSEGIVVPVEDKKAICEAILHIEKNEALHTALVEGCMQKKKTIQGFDSYVNEIVSSWKKTISQ